MIDFILRIFLIGLAAWRIASILVHEGIAAPIRKLIGIEHDEFGEPEKYPNTFFGALFSCVKCLSFWIGLLLLIAMFALPSVYTNLIIALFTVNGIVAYLEEHL